MENNLFEAIKSSICEKNINQHLEDGYTPLNKVCCNSETSEKILKFLVKKKADVNSKSETGTPLINLVKNSKNLRKEFLELFLKNKAQPNPSCSFSATFPSYLLLNENVDLEMIKLIINFKCDFKKTMKKEFSSVLHFYCLNRKINTEICDFLISLNIDPNLIDHRGEKCLVNAISVGNFSVIKYFVEKKLDVISTQNDSQQKNIIFHFFKFSHSRLLDHSLIPYLLDLKADVNHFDFRDNLSNVVELYLKNSSSTFQNVKLLIEQKVDLKNSSSGFILIQSKNESVIPILKLLLENNLDPNFKNTKFNTLLHYFIKYKENFFHKNINQIIFLLLIFGANPFLNEPTTYEIAKSYPTHFSFLSKICQNGFSWDSKFFSLFPSIFQEKIQTLIVSLKINKIFVPKPVMFIIFQFFVSFQFSSREKFLKNIQQELEQYIDNVMTII